MKRVRCPKCDGFITFDETKYATGQSLVFECPECHKQFAIRLGVSKLRARQKDEVLDEQENANDCGSIVVIENVFHYKQVIALHQGENRIGRYVQGTNINCPIETRDPSVDTTHCVINVLPDKKNGGLRYLLRDAPSETGTFVHNTILRDNDRMPLQDGDVVSIGATTFILRAAGGESD